MQLFSCLYNRALLADNISCLAGLTHVEGHNFSLLLSVGCVLTLSILNLCCHLHPLQAANCCRNSRLVVEEYDLKWVKIKENYYVLVNQFHGNFNKKTLVVGKLGVFSGM